MWISDPVDIRPFAGVDLVSLFPKEMFPGVTELYTRWERMLMGFRPSLYLTTRHLMRLEPLLKGNSHDHKNVFRWECVLLNLPGVAIEITVGVFWHRSIFLEQRLPKKITPSVPSDFYESANI